MEKIEILNFNEGNRAKVFEEIRKKSVQFFSEEKEKIVREIIKKVQTEGDKGLLEITGYLDHCNLEADQLAVSSNEFKDAENQVDEKILNLIKEAIQRIKDFHQLQLENSWFSHKEEGMIMGQLVRPIEKVGVYVPGGKADYPSSLIMGAVPALVAGVREISVVTPIGTRSRISPYLLMTARALGISKIFKVGGAQAVAALAYGTEIIDPVDKIVGPGNIYVTIAKKMVFGQVDIDMLAGPSEILIWAEEGANPDFIVADLFSQAEHDQEARAVFITTSMELARKVAQKVGEEIIRYERREIIEAALQKNGRIVVAESRPLVIQYINAFAPEHLELQLDDPWSYLGELKNFGAIFLGPYTPEPLGDYWAGPNHILPTMGSARQFSVLSTHDFIKRSSLIYCHKDRLMKEQEKIARFAELEGLSAHARGVRIRKTKEEFLE